MKKNRCDAADNDYFGGAVSIKGDRAIAGADRKNGYIGAVNVFSRNRGGPDNWDEVKKLVPAGTKSLDYAGYSVALSDNYALAGAKAGDGPIGDDSDTGAAHIFRDLD